MGVRTTAGAMAEIKAAVAHHQSRVFEQARRDGLRDRFEAYGADRLLAIARASMTSGRADLTRRVATKVIVRVDHSALGRGHVSPGEVCDTPTCTVEGCDLPRQEIDHRLDWATTHHTQLDQLDGLCRHHHALKTRQNYQLEPGTARRPIHAPGSPSPPEPDCPPGVDAARA